MASKEEKNELNKIMKMITVADDSTNQQHSSPRISVGIQKRQGERFEGTSSDTDVSDSANNQEEYIEETSATTVVAESTTETDAADYARELIVQEEYIEEISVEPVGAQSTTNTDAADSANEQNIKENCIEEMSVEIIGAQSTTNTNAADSANEQNSKENCIEEMSVEIVGALSTINTDAADSANEQNSEENCIKDVSVETDYFAKRLKDFVEKISKKMPLDHPNETAYIAQRVNAHISSPSILFVPFCKIIRYFMERESQTASDADNCNVSPTGKHNKACSTCDPEEKDIMSELIQLCPPSGCSLLFETVSQFETNTKLISEINRLRCEIEYKKLLIEQEKMRSVMQIDWSELNKAVMEELNSKNKEKQSYLMQEVDENNEDDESIIENNVEETDHIQPTKEQELDEEEAMNSSNENLGSISENTIMSEQETNGSPNMCDSISVLGENNEAAVKGLEEKDRDENEEVIKENGDVLENKVEKYRSSVEDVNKNEVVQCEPLSKEEQIEMIMKNAYKKVEDIMKFARDEVKNIIRDDNKSKNFKTKPTDEKSVKEDDANLESKSDKAIYQNEDLLKNGPLVTSEIDENEEKDENLGDENCESERTNDTVSIETTQKKTDNESESLLHTKQYGEEPKAEIHLTENEIGEKAIMRTDVSSDTQTQDTLSSNEDISICPELDTLSVNSVITEHDKISKHFLENKNPQKNHDNINEIEGEKRTYAHETQTDNESAISQLNGQYIKESDQEMQFIKENGLSEKATAITDESFDKEIEDKLMSEQVMSKHPEVDPQSDISVITEFDKTRDEFQENEKQQEKFDNINGNERELSKNTNGIIQTQPDPEMQLTEKDEIEKKAIISTDKSFDRKTEDACMIKQGTSKRPHAYSQSDISVTTESDKISAKSSVEKNGFTENISEKSNVTNLDKEEDQELSFNDSNDLNLSTMSVDQSTVTDLSFDITAEVHLLVVKRTESTGTDDQ